MKNKNLLVIIIAIFAILFASCSSYNKNEDLSKIPQNFEECASITGVILESYPSKCIFNNQTFIEEISIKDKCILNQGLWVESANECEYISYDTCIDLNGVFNECGSACRNNPDAELCTLQCVPFCSFDDNFKEDIIIENQSNDINKDINNDDNSNVLDSYGNLVAENCISWFDGCNNCQATENGLVCTKMFCQEIEEPFCKNYKE